MSKQLRIWLFVLLGTLLASSSLLAEGVITMTTSKAVGEKIEMYIIWANGNVTIEGVAGYPKITYGNYTLTSQTITIRGNVTMLYCPRNSLTSLDASGCTALTALNCSYNQLTTLDVSKNTFLTGLDCSWNQLTNLDVSDCTALTYLNCSYNQLGTLDVSKNTSLTELDCRGNQLTSLDVSTNTALTKLGCGSNRLTSLDVSKNPALTQLDCWYNQLTSLDVSTNTALTKLDCKVNQLTSLDLSQNTALTLLDCGYNQLTSLDLSHSSALTELNCYGKALTSLDLSNCLNLHYVDCSNNQINGEAMSRLVASLPTCSDDYHGQYSRYGSYPGGYFVPVASSYNDEWNLCSKENVASARTKNWTSLKKKDGGFGYNDFELYEGVDLNQPVGHGIITMTTGRAVGKSITLLFKANGPVTLEGVKEIRQSDGSAIYQILPGQKITIRGDVTALSCRDSELTSLRVSGCPSLTRLDCGENKLTSLDVSQNRALQKLLCHKNRLISLDVSQNSALNWLNCGYNQLTSLDVSQNTALKLLYCFGNQLTRLDISHNNELIELSCYYNQIKGAEMTKLVNSLPKMAGRPSSKFYVVVKDSLEGNVCLKSDVAVVADKGWTPLGYNRSTKAWEYYGGRETDSFGVSLTHEGEGSVIATGTDDLSAVPYGTELTITATPAEGYELAALTANGVDILESKSFVVKGYTEVKATFTQKVKYFAVTFSKTGEGTVTATGADDLDAVPYGTELTIEATPATGYELTALTANGEDILATQRFVVKGNTEVKATFTKKVKSFAVMFTQIGEGTVTATGADDLDAVPSGTELTIEATPATGYELTALTANGRDILSTKRFVVKGDTEVKAIFTKKERNYAVTFTQTGEGRVTATGADDLNAVPYGTELTIVATPKQGYELTALTANDKDILATKKVVVTGDLTIKATFAKETFVVTLDKEGEGVLDATGADDLKAVPYGTKLTIIATPAEGYELKALLANGFDIRSTKSVEVTGDTRIKAIFTQQTFAVTLTSNEHGKVKIVEPVDLQAVPYGTTLTISTTPETGYELTALTANGEDILATKSFVVKGATEIRATFSMAHFAVTLTHEGEGKVDATGAEDLTAVSYGTELTIVATPKQGYELTALTANDKDILATKKVVVTEDLTVKATFAKETFVVSLDKEGEGVLDATGADNLKVVPYGTKLTITATPAEGYELKALLADGFDIRSTKSVEVTGDTRIKAIFTQQTFAVTLTSNEHGKITIAEPVDLKVVPYGTKLTVKATGKNAQCVLTALTANGEDILATKSFVVKGATEVKATFVDHTGVETTVTQQTQLYPNPATDYVIVEGVAPASEVTLHSMTGERLYADRADSRGTLRIDLTPYADGVYLVCVADETYRVVVRH